MLIVLTSIVVAYARLLSAGFVSFDDDIQVYANPFLNPPTWESIGRLWQHAYQQLYVPLAYTILAGISRVAEIPAQVDSSLGHAVSLSATPFHVASLALHLANAWLCFDLVERLTGRPRTALICSLVFALHPLQVESVAWVSELRGLTSGLLVLLALDAFVASRQAGARALLALSAALAACAMLCKPSAAVLPAAALAIDRIVLRTPWRKTVAAVALWTAVVAPFVLVTRAVQSIPVAGQSAAWQRPFVAGDALAFYLFKLVVPVDLGVDYGRTPHWLMSHAWGYLTWLVPVALLARAYRGRRQRPHTWLGAVLLVTFLLPTLGLVPFAYQAYSTVADRYAYLALIGVGLIVADTIDHAGSARMANRAAAVLVAALAALTFGQTRHWLTSPAFLLHTIDVNPAAGFAYNNLGDTEQANGNLAAALEHYLDCVRVDPTRVKAHVNLAEVYAAMGRTDEAERAVAEAQQQPDLTADDLSNLGIVLMKMNQPARALKAFATAVALEPDSPTYLFNQANAFSIVGQLDQAEATFRRCIGLAPTLAGAHTGLGIVLARTGRLSDAVAEFRTAVRLQPDDPAARDDLQRAETMMQLPGR